MSSPADRDRIFSFVSYNILASSLGSSCIPWVLELKKELNDLFNSTTSLNFSEWIKIEGQKEYMAHFHRNYDSGNKNVMRNLWSASIENQGDIPQGLNNVIFVKRDTVQYVRSSDQQIQIATTLRGLLHSLCPSIGDEIYSSIMETEVYRAWTTRGPAIFREITSKACTELSGLESRDSIDIITLLEYDAHNLLANYRGCGVQESFSDAMQFKGFDTICMAERDSSGPAVFWNREKFELASYQGRVAGIESQTPCVHVLGVDEVIDGAKNIDLHEHYFPLGVEGDVRAELPDPERKELGLVELRHLPSGKVFLVAMCHFMTESRDNPACNKYPGQVRSEELLTARREVEATLAAKPYIYGVIFSGDFNCNLVSGADGSINELYIFEGKIKSVDGSSVWDVPTGWHHADAGPVSVFAIGDISATSVDDDGSVGGVGGGGSGKNSAIAGASASAGGGCSAPTEPSLEWEGVSLRETFAPIHQWGRAVGPHGVCSSFNAKRCSWIDFMWYSHKTLRVVARSDNHSPSEPIPNRDHPSDHLPIAATFEII